MGALHIVLLLDENTTEWLSSEGVAHPPASKSPQFPTPRQVREALERTPGCKASISANLASGEWSAEIEAVDPTDAAWAFLRMSDYSSDDEPHEFCFPQGWPEMIYRVVEQLTHFCGPLVVVDVSESRPVVICPVTQLMN